MNVKNLPEPKAHGDRGSQARAVGVLLAATVAWGGTFVVVKSAVSHTSVANFLAWRFLIAGGLLAALRPRSLMQLGRRDLRRGAVLGLVLAAGYLVQTLGLRHTTAAISGFLTGLQVVFTPVLAWVLLRHQIRPRVWLATVIALGGLGVMSLRGFSLSGGELLTVASAAIFALQVIGLSEWSTPANAYGMATAQLLTVAACSSLATLPTGPHLSASAGVWGAIIGTAVLATSFAFVAQSWAQSRLSAARAALVLTMEPVFAALTAWAAGGTIGVLVLIGGALVLAAMLLVELAEGRDHTGLAASSATRQTSDDGPSTTGHLSQQTTRQPPSATLQPAHAQPQR
jgi:drug/metabolite transporter (DMT)-like permease